ncbi:Beta-xylosidase [Streptomyces alboniger]
MTAETYTNPVLNADWSDPDVIRVGDDFYLTASSFGRAPGLPLLHSRDLVNWTLVGHALEPLEPASEFQHPRHDCGVWAPALRYHDERFWIFWGDPDQGIFQVNAPGIRGPWTRPHLIKAGKGLISNACPLWDDETGEAYLVHGWLKSCLGMENWLTGHRMHPDGTSLLDEGKVIVDGDRIPGWFTIEGPKLYRHPTAGSGSSPRPGGDRLAGRLPLARLLRAVRGEDRPGAEGHRRQRPPPGRLGAHPVRRGLVPALPAARRLRPGRPSPADELGDGAPPARARSQSGEAGRCSVPRVPPSPYTGGPICRRSRPLRPQPTTTSPADGRPPVAVDGQPSPTLGFARAGGPPCRLGHPALRGRPRTVLRPLGRPARPAQTAERPHSAAARRPLRGRGGTRRCTARVRARAGLAVLGDAFGWIGLQRGADGTVHLVHRFAEAVAETERDADYPRLAPEGRARLRIEIRTGARCRFFYDIGDGPRPSGPVFAATPWRWVGALLGLFSVAPAGPGHAGAASFTRFRITDL